MNLMKRISVIISIAALSAGTSHAADFFSTDTPEQLFNLGVRLGVNTSNRTVGEANMPGYNVQGWGTGFDIGVIADLNVRDYLSLQPGVFFESRSNTYTFINAVPTAGIPANEYLMTQAGTFNSYALTIPVIGSMRFNITDDIRWNVDFGPYVSFMFGSKLKNKVNHNSINNGGIPAAGAEFRQKAAPVDFGFKLGTGLQVLKHYSVGVHYMAGATRAWKDVKTEFGRYSYGGRTKAWVFTLGYDF